MRIELKEEDPENHGDVGRPINPTPPNHPTYTKEGSGQTAARLSSISPLIHTSTRPNPSSQSRRRRMSVRSPVPHTVTICTLATPLGFIGLFGDSRDRVSTENQTVEHNCPSRQSSPPPQPVMAVRVKHSEGTSVGHRGALQLWNGGALACRGSRGSGHWGLSILCLSLYRL